MDGFWILMLMALMLVPLALVLRKVRPNVSTAAARVHWSCARGCRQCPEAYPEV